MINSPYRRVPRQFTWRSAPRNAAATYAQASTATTICSGLHWDASSAAIMHILQTVSSLGVYGAERVLVTLSDGLNRLQHRTTVAVFWNAHSPNLEVANYARSHGLEVRLVPCAGRADWRCVTRLRDLLRQESIDLIHTHGYKADLYGYAATCGLSVARVSTCHNWIESNISTKLYGKLDRFVLRRFHALAAVSDTVALKLRAVGIPPGRMSVIRNGVDVEHFAAGNPVLKKELGLTKQQIIGYVGRFSPEKGPEQLLEAAARVLADNENVFFVLVGDGPQRGELEDKCRSLGIASKVAFPGIRADMPDVYASFDILALPSLDEGLPMTVLEAMAARCPVVATSVGGVPTLVADGLTGLLVPPSQPAALAKALTSLLGNSQLRSNLAQSGYQLVCEQYSVAAMVERYLELYAEAARVRGRSQISYGTTEVQKPPAKISR